MSGAGRSSGDRSGQLVEHALVVGGVAFFDLGEGREALGSLFQHGLELLGVLAGFGDLLVDFLYGGGVAFGHGGVAELGVHLGVFVGFAFNRELEGLGGAHAGLG